MLCFLDPSDFLAMSNYNISKVTIYLRNSSSVFLINTCSPSLLLIVDYLELEGHKAPCLLTLKNGFYRIHLSSYLLLLQMSKAIQSFCLGALLSEFEVEKPKNLAMEALC